MTAICLECGNPKIAMAHKPACRCPRKDPQIPVRAKVTDEMKPRQYVTAERLDLLEELSRVSEELVEVEERHDVLQIKREDILEQLRNTP